VAFSILAYATASTHFHAVFIEGRTRAMAVAAPLAAVVNVALNLLLLPSLGLVGASVATVAAYAALTAVAVLAAGRSVELPGVLRDCLACWAVAVPVVLAGAYLPATPLGAAARVAAGVALLAVGWRVAVRTFRGLDRDAAREPVPQPPTRVRPAFRHARIERLAEGRAASR
jgi:O-antigen/teichoic acid export membrane protein